MNAFFKHRDVYKYKWYRPSSTKVFDKLMHSFVRILKVLDILVKQWAKLTTDYHLVVGFNKITQLIINKLIQQQTHTDTCDSIDFGKEIFRLTKVAAAVQGLESR